MKKFTYFLTAAVVVALASCSTSNDVVSKNGIQKRKYNQGFYVDAKGKQTVDPVAAAKAKSANAAEWTVALEETASSTSFDEPSFAAGTVTPVASAPAPVIVKANPLARAAASAFSFKGFNRNFDFSKADFSSRASVYSAASSASVEPSTLVYILLILLVPFGTTISMYLYEGDWTKRVTVNLILTLLCGLPGLIHALVIIFGNK